MRYGSLLLCGDAAHIVPPTGANGLNLAASDVHCAAEALSGFFRRNDADAIAAYSAKAMARVWKSELFSWSLTKLMHRFAEDGPFERVLTADGKPIPGLYAAEAEAASVMGGHYQAGGISLGPAMVFGYIAAREAASSGQ